LNRKEQIKLMCPLLAMNKKAIVEYGAWSKVDYKYTYTCYSGDEIADATTPSSSLRIKGFADAGYIDPQPYKQNLTKFWKKNKCAPFPEEVFLSLEGTRGP
jgi:7-cyano-7-deazaguanine synthase in queuosine biosynthesis